MSRFGVQQLKHWKRIGAPQLVLRWLEHGVELPFRGNTPPTTLRVPNNISPEDQSFVDRHTDMWVNSRVAERVPSVDSLKFVSPLNVVNRSSALRDKRLLLNLRTLNQSIDSPFLKGESIVKALQSCLRPNDWMVKFDLQSGFSHLRIHRESAPYLGFEWNDEFFQYTALPAGLSISPFCFNTTMQVVMNYITKTLKARSVRFIDDWLVVADDFAAAEELSQQILELFHFLGLTVGDKTMLKPVQNLTYVGTVVDTTNNVRLYPPVLRLEQLYSRVSELLASADAGPVAAGAVSGLYGRLNAAVKDGGPQELLEAKSMLRDLRQRNQDGKVTLSLQTREDLILISELLDCLISQRKS